MDILIPVLIGTLLNLAALYIEYRDSKLKYDKLMAQNAELAKRVRKLEYEREWFNKRLANAERIDPSSLSSRLALLNESDRWHEDRIANLEDGLNMHIRVFDHVFEPITPPDVYDVNLNITTDGIPPTG